MELSAFRNNQEICSHKDTRHNSKKMQIHKLIVIHNLKLKLNSYVKLEKLRKLYFNILRPFVGIPPTILQQYSNNTPTRQTI
jgi:hypothetical protein